MTSYILTNLAYFAICIFAMRAGSLVERLAGAWLLINITVFAVAIALERQSPIISLMSDGVFSIGLLPLAIFFASWSIGVMCVVQACSFMLQAWYLMTDRPADHLFATLTTVACWGVALALLGSTIASAHERQRLQGRTRGRSPPYPSQSPRPQS